VFMGSPEFAVPVLESLATHYYLVGVISQPDRPAGRGQGLVPPPVKLSAQRLGIPVFQPEKLRLPEALSQLQAWSPDLMVVAAFGQILRQEVLSLPHQGCINVHASLLPRWRGAAPIQAAILAGDKETGITIMKMDPGVDTGPILNQRALAIHPQDTTSSLAPRLSILGAELLLETLPGYLSGSIQPQPQPDQGITYAPMLKKEDGWLDFSQPALALERRIRAMHPWPGTSMDWEGLPLKILAAHVGMISNLGIQTPGFRTVEAGMPAVVAGDNTLLVLDEVLPPGRRVMPGRAFLAGARNWQEEIVE
jgi:methionyl-tRNA formyltransferase